MKAIAIKVKGSLGEGALALCFPNAESMGLFAMQLLRMAKMGNCNICVNASGTSPEQGKLNVDMAAFESRCMPNYGVSRIQVPEARVGHLLVAAPNNTHIVRMNGFGGRVGRPNAELFAQPGSMEASCAVKQPWEKLGISKEEWKDNRNRR